MDTMKNTLLAYYNETQPFESRRHSTLIAALNDARRATSRANDGKGWVLDLPVEGSGNWLGAMAYMTVLDQIGSTLTLANKGDIKSPSCDNSIYRALDDFSENLNNLEIHALVGLRNAFFHKFSLVNIGQDRNSFKEEQTHRFVVHNSPRTKLVILPQVKWDKNMEDKSLDPLTATHINLFELGNEVERIILKIRSLINSEDVQLRKGTIQAFVNQYTFVILGK